MKKITQITVVPRGLPHNRLNPEYTVTALRNAEHVAAWPDERLDPDAFHCQEAPGRIAKRVGDAMSAKQVQDIAQDANTVLVIKARGGRA